jgi:alkanesulfonate monooxygenase SsuD/methylene tetrahydromethanopterin reductase-like flavin-dependent oxidoreductase (luciferase family)
MKIGVQLPEVEWEVPFPQLIEMAQAAESVGFDSVWYGDHLIYDLAAGARGPWEAWTTLAAIAAATSTIELGPLVASTSFHAPAMLAKQAATVDAISEGRLTVGLGAGWNQREYDAFGFPTGLVASRKRSRSSARCSAKARSTSTAPTTTRTTACCTHVRLDPAAHR